jgi:hypothetical protein
MKRNWTWGLWGLVALAFVGIASPRHASAADVVIYWPCASTSASGVTTYGQCPVNLMYPLPVITATLPLPTGASTAANQILEVAAINAVVSAIVAAALTPPLSITGNTSTVQQVAITTGGTAQNLFSGATPTNGYEVCNADASIDAWISETTTAAANTGYRVPANGGCYSPPLLSKPASAISVFSTKTGLQLAVRSY